MFILGEDYLIFNYLLLLLRDYSIFNTSVGYIKGDHLTNTSFLVHPSHAVQMQLQLYCYSFSKK